MDVAKIIEPEKTVLFKFKNSYSRDNAPLICYIEHPGYQTRLTHFEVGGGGSEFDLVYTTETIKNPYSICFQADKRAASGEEILYYFQDYPDTNPDDADFIYTAEQVELELSIRPSTRISEQNRTAVFPEGDEITFTIDPVEKKPTLFSVLVAVARSPQFVPSKDPSREAKGKPIKNPRTQTVWSMNTPMISERIIDLFCPTRNRY
jgi:hypothetical protein